MSRLSKHRSNRSNSNLRRFFTRSINNYSAKRQFSLNLRQFFCQLCIFRTFKAKVIYYQQTAYSRYQKVLCWQADQHSESFNSNSGLLKTTFIGPFVINFTILLLIFWSNSLFHLLIFSLFISAHFLDKFLGSLGTFCQF